MANFVARPMEYIVGWLLTSGLCILDRYFLSTYSTAVLALERYAV